MARGYIENTSSQPAEITLGINGQLKTVSVPSGESELHIPITENLSPTAVINASRTSGTAPLTVNFDASASSDSDGSITNYEWDFDYDGINFNSNPLVVGVINPTHTYTNTGDYTAALKVTDNGNPAQSDIATIPISVKLPQFTLTVTNGTGSGTYDTGTVVNISTRVSEK